MWVFSDGTRSEHSPQPATWKRRSAVQLLWGPQERLHHPRTVCQKVSRKSWKRKLSKFVSLIPYAYSRTVKSDFLKWHLFASLYRFAYTIQYFSSFLLFSSYLKNMKIKWSSEVWWNYTNDARQWRTRKRDTSLCRSAGLSNTCTRNASSTGTSNSATCFSTMRWWWVKWEADNFKMSNLTPSTRASITLFS